MLEAIAAYESGDGGGRDSVRDMRRVTSTESPRFRSLRKAYELNFQPADAPYAVSVVFRGNAVERHEIVETLRDLIRRLGSGELDFERDGRFLKSAEKKTSETEPSVDASGAQTDGSED